MIGKRSHLKDEGVEGIPNEPFRFYVQSRTARQQYLVDLEEFGWNGACSCQRFTFKCLPLLKMGAHPAGHLRCWHIERARDWFIRTIGPKIAANYYSRGNTKGQLPRTKEKPPEQEVPARRTYYIKPVSDAQGARLEEYLRLRIPWLKAHPWCRSCAVRGFKKQAPTTDVHHSRGKIGALLCDMRFWIPVCRNCHDWIGSNPEEARSLGLLCQPGEWNTPVEMETEA